MSILGLDIGSVAISAVLMNRKREIIKQFYYKKGMYINKFTFDNTIIKATELLHDEKKYNKILK